MFFPFTVISFLPSSAVIYSLTKCLMSSSRKTMLDAQWSWGETDPVHCLMHFTVWSVDNFQIWTAFLTSFYSIVVFQLNDFSSVAVVFKLVKSNKIEPFFSLSETLFRTLIKDVSLTFFSYPPWFASSV